MGMAGKMLALTSVFSPNLPNHDAAAAFWAKITIGDFYGLLG